MKALSGVLFLGLAAGGAISLGLALWRESDRVEALLITLVTLALAVGYCLIFRSGKQSEDH